MDTFTLFDFIPQALLIVDSNFVVRYWNSTMESWTGKKREQVVGLELGSVCSYFLKPVYRSRLDLLFTQGVPVVFSSHFHRQLFPAFLPNGNPRIQHTTVTPLPEEGGAYLALFTVVDVSLQDEMVQTLGRELRHRRTIETALEESLEEKELLIREVHHRVKNNLSLVSSLISLHADNLFSRGYREGSQLLGELRAKVDSLSLLYSKLYRGGAATHIDLREYLEELAHTLLYATTPEDRNEERSISLDTLLADVVVETDAAISIGLIVAELLTNAVKHAFRETEAPRIRLLLEKRTDSCYALEVSDNGRGLPEDFSPESSDSFGMVVISSLTQQLGGTLHCENRTDGGASFLISFCGNVKEGFD